MSYIEYNNVVLIFVENNNFYLLFLCVLASYVGVCATCVFIIWRHA